MSSPVEEEVTFTPKITPLPKVHWEGCHLQTHQARTGAGLGSVQEQVPHPRSGRPIGRQRCLPGFRYAAWSPPSSGLGVPLRVLCAEVATCSARAALEHLSLHAPRCCYFPGSTQHRGPCSGHRNCSNWGLHGIEIKPSTGERTCMQLWLDLERSR